jgi:hypothetical protein
VKKLDRFYNIGIGVLVIGIAAVLIFKFVLDDPPHESFRINGIDQIIVSDLNGNEIKLSEFLAKDTATYFMLFGLNDCFSCIYLGLEDLKVLKKAGRPCFGLVVHDYIEEVGGWAAQYDFTPFLVLKKLDFLENIKSASTPVFVKFADGKVESYGYISPN